MLTQNKQHDDCEEQVNVNSDDTLQKHIISSIAWTAKHMCTRTTYGTTKVSYITISHFTHHKQSSSSQLPINILHTIATFRTSQKLNFNFKCTATTREFGSVLLSRVHLVLLTLDPHDFLNDFP